MTPPLPAVISFLIFFASVVPFAQASFIQPAAPALVSPRTSPTFSAGRPSAATHPLRHRAASTSSSLFAKKKKGGGGSTATKKGKVQVLLLQTVPTIGQTGDIVAVSSAVFRNKLQLGNKARLVTPEEVETREREEAERETRRAERAVQTKTMVEEAMLENMGEEERLAWALAPSEVRGVALTLRKKAGPRGNLFGGVTPRLLTEALEETFPAGSWDGRGARVTAVRDAAGKDVKRKALPVALADRNCKIIRDVGTYTVTMALTPSVEVTFNVAVVPE